MERCVDHPDEGALARCESCGKPLCRECAISAPRGLSFCKDDADDLVLAVGMARETRRGLGRTVKAWGAFALLGLLGVALGTGGFLGGYELHEIAPIGITAAGLVFFFVALSRQLRFWRRYGRRS